MTKQEQQAPFTLDGSQHSVGDPACPECWEAYPRPMRVAVSSMPRMAVKMEIMTSGCIRVMIVAGRVSSPIRRAHDDRPGRLAICP